MSPRSRAATGAAERRAPPSLPLGLEPLEARGILLGGLFGRTSRVEIRHVICEAEDRRPPFRPADLPLAAGGRTDNYPGPMELMEHLEVLAARAAANLDMLL